MRETYEGLFEPAYALLSDAVAEVSARADRQAEAARNWEAEVRRLREILWHREPAGFALCPRCDGSGRPEFAWEQECAACSGAGRQRFGTAAEAPLAQAASHPLDPGEWYWMPAFRGSTAPEAGR
jgi:hypothetical protein